MLNEKTTETGNPETDQSATPSGDNQEPTSKESEKPETDSQGDSQEPTSDPVDKILNEEESARKAELEAAALKEENDRKSREGRERKARDDEIQGLQDKIRLLEKLVANSDNAQPTNPDTEDNFFVPDRPWLDRETGEVDWEAVPQHLLRNQQMQEAQQQKFQQTLQELQGNITGMEQERKEESESVVWQQKFGISDENYKVFKRLQKQEGDASAFEYLGLATKESEGIRAAQALQDEQRATAPILASGPAPPNVTERENAVESMAQEIADMPLGEARTLAAYELHEKLDPATASAVLNRAQELTKAKVA